MFSKSTSKGAQRRLLIKEKSFNERELQVTSDYSRLHGISWLWDHGLFLSQEPGKRQFSEPESSGTMPGHTRDVENQCLSSSLSPPPHGPPSLEPQGQWQPILYWVPRFNWVHSSLGLASCSIFLSSEQVSGPCSSCILWKTLHVEQEIFPFYRWGSWGPKIGIKRLV